MFHRFRDVLAELALTEATIGLEKNFFDAALHEVFSAHILPQATVVSATPVLSRLRIVKDADEVDLLRHAAQVADTGMDAAVRAVSDGILERIVAAEADYAMRHAGADGWAAPTYVASGWRSPMAHGPASSKGITSGDVVRIHVAPIVEGDTVDLCRTALDEIDLATYYLFHATRAEALRRAGRHDDAADALRRAIALTSNTTERHHLERQLASLG
jgi:Xaa-Pro aminopeptidase